MHTTNLHSSEQRRRLAFRPSGRTAARAMAHGLDVRGRLQIQMHARADGPGGGERRADGAVLRQMALLARRRHTGARRGRVLHRQPAYARSRRGLAAPRRAPRTSHAALLHHLGLREHQRVGMVRRFSHSWCVLHICICPSPLQLFLLPDNFFFLSFSMTLSAPITFLACRRGRGPVSPYWAYIYALLFDAQETRLGWLTDDARLLFGRFFAPYRHASDREAGLLFGRPRDPVRAIHDRRATPPSVPRD